MIDCKITENYLKERGRMTNSCEIHCDNCPLSRYNNGEKIICIRYETKYRDRAVEIVQQWSDKHPRKTILDDLKEKYPNYKISSIGTPSICPYKLGYEESAKCPAVDTCAECWNRPLDEVMKK